MKNTILAIFIVMCLFEAYSSPIEPKGEILHRFRRFTCDVLSIEAGTIKISHAACALHCVALDYKGGYCNDKAVCVCRN